MKSRRKNTNKGYNQAPKYSGIELQFRHYCSYMGILVDMSGGYSAKISLKGWTDEQVVNVLVGTLTTCLMTCAETQEG